MQTNISKKKPWTLSIGCHRGTLISRDSDLREHDSLEDCKKDVSESERSWARIGYFVWFATARGPNREEVKLHAGTAYK